MVYRLPHLALRLLLLAMIAICCADFASAQETSTAKKPNFVVIFCDDLGYGDLGCFGNPTIRTKHLDQMASEGMKFTQFYVAASVCTPSRAGLMTGRLPCRSGMCSNTRRVLFPNSKGGLPAEEFTIAEALKEGGYATACIGKWHLGHHKQFLPTSNGFDYYFGIPYSNDMDRIASAPKGRESFWHPKSEYFNVPLMRNEEIVERPADQTTITRRYTEETVKFIDENKDKPFFVYLAHSMPHVPLFRSPEFEGVSRRGYYGDVIEEIDWSVGQVLQKLRETGLDENTLVVFCSDNGPWLIYGDHGGSAGPLRDGKGSTFDGGMREPTIFWWPKTIPAAEVAADVGSTMDLMATFTSLAGLPLPSDRKLDSYDLTPVLKQTGKSKREALFYYRGYELMAVRVGPWKMHLKTQTGYGQPKAEVHNPPLLYQLEEDPGESRDLAKENPEVIQSIQKLIEQHQKEMVFADSQLEL
ncbi:arylsulfatase [Blastopirellula marina]|uniref:Arylsulfatase n=1 Tax=Blastopirellula marina TaxID=124 RepID=A0A2S8FAE6_9BACT|nr:MULTISPECIES: sulfatase [Pirellulaceae]PQO29143.1 arylsulfatase [Blastopirellula marina]RCS50334.1 arylsulfatase [Bremerella cremea]